MNGLTLTALALVVVAGAFVVGYLRGRNDAPRLTRLDALHALRTTEPAIDHDIDGRRDQW